MDSAALHRLSIEFICVFGMPPVEFIHLAADLGVRQIGLACAPIVANPHGYPAWNLLGDADLVRQTKAALQGTGVRIALSEGFLIMPGIEIGDAAAKLDILADLGARIANCVIIEADRSRAIDQFASFAAMAEQRGMAATIEFMPMVPINDYHAALDIIRASGAANGQLLIDAMHFYRSGSTSAELAAIDPPLIGHAQLCDVPMPPVIADYGHEARDERLCPGKGNLPLREFLSVLPRDLVVGLEVPMLSRAEAGEGAAQRLSACISAASAMLSELG